MPSNTTQSPQFVIGQQIDTLQSQLTGLMTKMNDHINARFQQLEEKLKTKSVPAKSATSISSQSSEIIETMANRARAYRGGVSGVSGNPLWQSSL